MLTLLLFGWLLGACSDEHSEPAPPSPGRDVSAHAPSPRAADKISEEGRDAPFRTAEPRGDPRTPEPLLGAVAEPPTTEARSAAMPAPLVDRTPAARTCVLQSDVPLVVFPHGGPPAVLALGDAFLVAAYQERQAQIVWVRPGQPPQPSATIALEGTPRDAAPALARLDHRAVAIAMIDGRGRVLEATFDPASRAGALRVLAVAERGADPRFAPALRPLGTRHVVAWTDGSETPMRLRLAIVEHGAVVLRHDATPVAGGGAAPFFAEGPREHELYFLDPRAGISVAHRVRIADDGTVGPTEVARPLSLVAEPPAIAVARPRSGSRTWLAYAAVGNLATRAVGLVEAVGLERPLPLVAGLGYGDPLTLDALAGERAAIFATEAPSAAAADAPHEIRVRQIDDAGLGEPLVLAAPATDPALARRDDGLIAIAHRRGDEVRVHFARCAD